MVTVSVTPPLLPVTERVSIRKSFLKAASSAAFSAWSALAWASPLFPKWPSRRNLSAATCASPMNKLFERSAWLCCVAALLPVRTALSWLIFATLDLHDLQVRLAAEGCGNTWSESMDVRNLPMIIFLSGGAVAQLGARLDGIEEVVGSNPIGSTK